MVCRGGTRQGAGTPLTRSPGTFPFARESCGRWKQVGKEEPRRLSGKTAMMTAIIRRAAAQGARVWVCDPLRTELADLQLWPNVEVVATTVDDIAQIIHTARRLSALTTPGRPPPHEKGPALGMRDGATFRAGRAPGRSSTAAQRRQAPTHRAAGHAVSGLHMALRGSIPLPRLHSLNPAGLLGVLTVQLIEDRGPEAGDSGSE